MGPTDDLYFISYANIGLVAIFMPTNTRDDDQFNRILFFETCQLGGKKRPIHDKSWKHDMI